MRHRSLALALGLLALCSTSAFAQSEDMGPRMFQSFVKSQARELRAGDAAPATKAEWAQTRSKLRANLLKAWGGFPEVPCPLDPQSHGTLQRDEEARGEESDAERGGFDVLFARIGSTLCK